MHSASPFCGPYWPMGHLAQSVASSVLRSTTHQARQVAAKERWCAPEASKYKLSLICKAPAGHSRHACINTKLHPSIRPPMHAYTCIHLHAHTYLYIYAYSSQIDSIIYIYMHVCRCVYNVCRCLFLCTQMPVQPHT